MVAAAESAAQPTGGTELGLQRVQPGLTGQVTLYR